YRQKDGLTAPVDDHAMVHLKFEPIDDGMTFKLTGGFWDTVPASKDGKSGWQNMLNEGHDHLKQGDAIDHPADEDSRLTIAPICGPVVQQDPGTFAIRFGRIGFDNPKRCNDIWFILTYPGDGTYKRMVQQAELRFPLHNTKGTPQTIDFHGPADVKVGDGLKPVQLRATSS